MDLKSEILREHSKAQTNKIIAYVGDSEYYFKELIVLFLSNEYLIAQRAAWPLSYIAIAHPEFIKPHNTQLLTTLKQPQLHGAIKRNILRIWAEVMPPEKLWGELFEVCYSFLRNKKEPVAIKVFSMQVMFNIACKYPELRFELESTIQDLMLLEKPAIVSRGSKILKWLKKV